MSMTPAINFSPVSLTPLNSFSPVSVRSQHPSAQWNLRAADEAVLNIVRTKKKININSRISPRIFEKIQNGPNGILGGLGDTDS